MNKKKENISTRSRRTELLETRIAQNVGAQKIDLAEWIFDRIEIESGSKVLELCSGTGAQTLHLINRVGETGHVFPSDVSRKTLDKLDANIKTKWKPRVTSIEADMDSLSDVLDGNGFVAPHFDMVFCAYGLYYSKNVAEILQEIKRWLRPKGRLVVVGPFGPNNDPLFNLLEQAGVVIQPCIKYTSTDFMFKEVLSWAAKHFEKVFINTVVNQIAWQEPTDVLTYWKNSTFYDSERLTVVKKLVDAHFSMNSEFVNEKWIMMIEAKDVRK
ncbi:class I SAM-dependent methyltransferase [Desulfococcaceae bacterium HSG9]|nr:class I SAM-dependent methyltransferase [Desulfococcaceae bacterium HSG9]